MRWGTTSEKSDPLYKHWPAFVVVTPCASAKDGVIAYAVLYDSLAQGFVDCGAEISAFRGEYRYYEAEQGDVDMYFVLGPTVIDVVQKLSWLTGRSVPPPRWALGYLGSTVRVRWGSIRRGWVVGRESGGLSVCASLFADVLHRAARCPAAAARLR